VIRRANADVSHLIAMSAVLDDEVGATDHRQRANLRYIGRVVERAHRNGFVKEQWFLFELERSYKHIVKRRLFGCAGQWRIRVAS
jgi:hypothetical protein